MVKLEDIYSVYKQNCLSNSEIEYIEILNKFKEWRLLTDWEKLERRKKENDYWLMHFESDPSLKYNVQGVSLLRSILVFLDSVQPKFACISAENYHLLDDEDKKLFRLMSTLYAEKELITAYPRILSTRVHIPEEIIASIINSLAQTTIKQYEMGEFLIQYRDVLSEHKAHHERYIRSAFSILADQPSSL